MEWSAIFAGLGVISTIAAGVIGGYVRGVSDDVRELRRDLTNHKVSSAEKFITADDLKEIKESLHRIEVILHGKADK